MYLNNKEEESIETKACNTSLISTKVQSLKNEEEEKVHAIKWTEFLGRTVPVVCQNLNGPCPLLAICNVLLLRGYISIQKDLQFISQNELIHMVGNRILETNPPLEDKRLLETQQKTLEDVMQLLPRLLVGLDVNVRFGGTHDFEYTPECATFDFLDINLVHGWLVDPHEKETVDIIENKSYNQLVEELIEYKSLEDVPRDIKENEAPISVGESACAPIHQTDALNMEHRNEVRSIMLERKMSQNTAMQKVSKIYREGPILEAFLNNTASQLTVYGLQQLNSSVKNRELCVFFRNNHFSTMFRYNNDLYLLVTDAGYCDVPEVVWEKLSSIDGNTAYCDANFTIFGVSAAAQEASVSTTTPDADYLLALKLQKEEEEEKEAQVAREAPSFSRSRNSSPVTHSKTWRRNQSQLLLEQEYTVVILLCL